MILGLPEKGPRARAMGGHTWSETDYLLANVIDAVNYVTAVLVAANSKNGKFKEPAKFYRPGDENKGRLGRRGRISRLAAVERLQMLSGSATPEQAEMLAAMPVHEG